MTTKKSIFNSLPVFGPRGLNRGIPVPKPITLDKPKKGLKRVSVKHQNELKEYNKQRKVFLTLHPFCMMKLKGCTHIATTVHHSKGRIGKIPFRCNMVERWVYVVP